MKRGKFNYRTEQKRIDKLKALALLLGIDVNEILDEWLDNGLENVYDLLTEGELNHERNRLSNTG